jgi:aspartate aminotransferase
MKTAIDAGNLGYTAVPGRMELLEAICASYRQNEGIIITPRQAMATPGSKKSFANLTAVVLNPGDNVVIPAPAWVGYRPLVERCGASCNFIPCTEENDFKLAGQKAIEDLRASINHRTRLLVLNSPNNPTGSVYTYDEWVAIAEVLYDHPDVIVCGDEIYSLLDKEKTPSFAQVVAELNKNSSRPLGNPIVRSSGLAKPYGELAGMRLGTIVGPEFLISAMTEYQTSDTGNSNVLGQIAMEAALKYQHEDLPVWIAKLEKRRELVYREVDGIEGIRCLKPKEVAGFYGDIMLEELIGSHIPGGGVIRNASDFTDYVLDDAHVAMVPSCAFEVDPKRANFARLSFGGADENLLRQGFAQMRTAIAQLR